MSQQLPSGAEQKSEYVGGDSVWALDEGKWRSLSFCTNVHTENLNIGTGDRWWRGVIVRLESSSGQNYVVKILIIGDDWDDEDNTRVARKSKDELRMRT
jgi:hypothetical protein